MSRQSVNELASMLTGLGGQFREQGNVEANRAIQEKYQRLSEQRASQEMRRAQADTLAKGFMSSVEPYMKAHPGMTQDQAMRELFGKLEPGARKVLDENYFGGILSASQTGAGGVGQEKTSNDWLYSGGRGDGKAGTLFPLGQIGDILSATQMQEVPGFGTVNPTILSNLSRSRMGLPAKLQEVPYQR